MDLIGILFAISIFIVYLYSSNSKEAWRRSVGQACYNVPDRTFMVSEDEFRPAVWRALRMTATQTIGSETVNLSRTCVDSSESFVEVGFLMTVFVSCQLTIPKRVLLRMHIEARASNSMFVKSEFSMDGQASQYQTFIQDEMIPKFFEDIDRELGMALPNYSKSILAISQSPQSVAQPSISKKLASGSNSVPSRLFHNIDLDMTVQILRNYLNGDGILKNASGTKGLRWKSATERSKNNPGFLECSISLSQYENSPWTAKLTDEIVMRWTVTSLAMNRVKLDCSWTGLMQPNCGDLVRHIMEKVDAELVAAGAVQFTSSALQARGQSPKPGSHASAWYKEISDVELTPKPSPWPSLQDFNEAVQNPNLCFSDAELKNGELALTALGLPKVATGAFASVYQVNCSGKCYAVRCFNNPITDREERYRRTSKFICSDDLIYTVDLHYIEKGILVKGNWFPILKMEWVQGQPLYDYVNKNYNDKVALERLRRRFSIMMAELQRSGIAHSDLQHGNIIIRKDDFILIDYDGMFVPELSGFFSHERGHPNYQHPERSGKHFGPYLDNFSAWVIDSAFLCVVEDPGLWKRFSGDCESLLFHRSDFEQPDDSQVFAALREHANAKIAERAEYLLSLLKAPVHQIPFLAAEHAPLLLDQLERAEALEKEPSSQTDASLQPAGGKGLPDWMT